MVCVEADAGWVPHYMYRMDHAYERHRYWLPAGTLTRMPSEYFRENVYTTFQDDWVAFQVKDLCNIRRLLWANDFPHSDSTWPGSHALLAKHARTSPTRSGTSSFTTTSPSCTGSSPAHEGRGDTDPAGHEGARPRRPLAGEPGGRALHLALPRPGPSPSLRHHARARRPPVLPGVVGGDLTLAQGVEAARYAALTTLAVLKYALGDLDRVQQFVHMLGFVNSAPGFNDQPRVINGAADFLVELYGERGKPTRAAIGCQGLGGGASVEIIVTVLFSGSEVRPPLARDAFAG